jgi:hypothetical protein
VVRKIGLPHRKIILSKLTVVSSFEEWSVLEVGVVINPRVTPVNFSKSHPVSVSLIFLPNLNAKLSFSTVSAYATVVFQHLLQPCFSIYYSSVSASTTAVFQHLLQQCFSICYSSVSAYTQHCVSAYATAWCFSISYSGVSASKNLIENKFLNRK